MTNTEAFWLGAALGAMFILVAAKITPARSADLPISPLTCSLGQPPCTAVPKPPELCLERDKKPYVGQTLQEDKTCPTGLRWVYQK